MAILLEYNLLYYLRSINNTEKQLYEILIRSHLALSRHSPQ